MRPAGRGLAPRCRLRGMATACGLRLGLSDVLRPGAGWLLAVAYVVRQLLLLLTGKCYDRQPELDYIVDLLKQFFAEGFHQRGADNFLYEVLLAMHHSAGKAMATQKKQYGRATVSGGEAFYELERMSTLEEEEEVCKYCGGERTFAEEVSWQSLLVGPSDVLVEVRAALAQVGVARRVGRAQAGHYERKLRKVLG